MSLTKGVDQFVGAEQRSSTGEQDNPWRFRWPNTADFNFNYYRLLELSEPKAIAHNRNKNIRVAIIGAGIGGLVAARELFRCGYTKIDIYEASGRIAGRNYSVPVEGQHTTFELGAMRMPFFDAPGSKNSVLDYYSHAFGITTQPFPNPGGKVADTGIYMNSGFGPDAAAPYPSPRMDIWRTTDTKPPAPKLEVVYEKWSRFAEMFISVAKEQYTKSSWPDFWRKVARHYWTLSFRELVYLKSIDTYDPKNEGYFGGLGMNEEEATLFYVIGAGDGGWGAFYDISCLFPLRTLLFGYGMNHQLVQGRFNADGTHAPGPQHRRLVTDSLGNELDAPNYLGMQTFSECLFYEKVKSPYVKDISLYDATRHKEYEINLYTRNGARRITRLGGKLQVSSPARTAIYDAVIVTPPTWAVGMSLNFDGFEPSILPFRAINSIDQSHWITSAKVFFPLTRRYWEETNIPQLISTDTFLQGVYGFGVETQAFKDPGVLLASYTWEDDANKLIPYEDEALAKRCLEKLDDLLTRSTNIGRPISPYVNRNRPCIIHWAKEPTYRGCAKLYRSRSWNQDYALLTYNQEHSRNSGLYLAGEAYSVEGGWTEPALRSGLDAVVHIARNTGAVFEQGFDFDKDYPRYSLWDPSKQ